MATSTTTDVIVRPVKTKADRKRFLDFPYDLYRGNPYFVPPLRMDVANTINPDKNPFFEHGDMQLFLAEDANGNMVGRVAGIKNGMHLKKYDDGNGFFGFFECIEDYAVAEKLLDAARNWVEAHGLTGMRGPTHPTLTDISALLVDGVDRVPFILMPYNPPYYEPFVLRYGFEKAMVTWAYYLDDEHVQTAKLERGVNIVKRRNPNLSLRAFDMKRFDEEIATIMDIYNEAWSENWGHVPYTDAEAAYLAKEVKPVIDPRLIYIVEDAGVPMAFVISLPNLNRALHKVKNGRLFPSGLFKILWKAKVQGIDEVRMPLMGVRKAYHGRGIDALLVLETIQRGMELGFRACEMSWVLDSNKPLVNALDKMGAHRDKEYGLYEMRF